MEKDDIRIAIVGDLDMEDLSADVYYKDKFILCIDQEKGNDSLEVEIGPLDKSVKLPLANLLEIIEYIKKRLWELRKDEQQSLKLEDYQ